MNKFYYWSDIHLEFYDNPMDFNIPKHKNSYLILAGDIIVISNRKKYKEWFKKLNKSYKEILWVFGNHEHYNGNLPTNVLKMRELLLEWECDNIIILDNEILISDNICFIGTTLWTDFNRNELDKYYAHLQMNDYNKIRIGPISEPWKRKLSVDDTINFAKQNKKWIIEQIKLYKDKYDIVLITHHGVTSLSLDPNYTDLNNAYYMDLSDLFKEDNVSFSIHGHIHCTKDYMCYNTNVLANPKGYPAEKQPNFDVEKYFEL